MSARAFKCVALAQVLALVLLALGLGLIYGEVHLLHHAAMEPMLEGGHTAVLRRLCRDSHLGKQLHEKFGNVVLIINSFEEEASHANTNFMRSLYGRFFGEVAVIFQSGGPNVGVQEKKGQYRWRGNWFFAFWLLPKVFADYPNADGYLWMDDDVALNYWHLLDSNVSKIWLYNDPDHPEVRYFPFDGGAEAKWTDWAAEKDCRERAGKAYFAMDEMYRKQFDESVYPLSGIYPKRICELFYIPHRLAHALSFDLLPVYREYKLWSEVALPMMFYALDSPKNWDHVLDDMVYNWAHWDQTKVYDPTEVWAANVSSFHPWKLVGSVSRTQMLLTFSSVDPCTLALLPNNVKAR